MAKLQPMPPKRHFTTTIAKTEPITHCHIGAVAGSESASSTPVITADRSPTVCSFFVSRLNTNSESTEDTVQASMIKRARTPKSTTDAITAGASAISTSAIMVRVVFLVCI